MRLFHTKTGKPVLRGDTVTDLRGDKAIVMGWREPQNEASIGQIRVRNVNESNEAEYYPSVFHCKFRGED